MTFVDFLFPRRCIGCGRVGSYLCRSCFSKIEFVTFQICPYCRKAAVGGVTHFGCRRRLGLDGLLCVFVFDKVGRNLIHQLKFQRVSDLKSDINRLLVATLGEGWNQFQNFVIVPVPLTKKRENWRGFNQAALIARQIAENLKIPLYPALVRTIDRRPQASLAKNKRSGNVAGVFEILKDKPVKNINALVLDDVFTTGATLKEAAKVLKREGARQVWAITLARSR